MPEDPLILLLLVVLQSAVLAAATIGLYWAGVFVVRWFGRETSYSLKPLGFTRPRGGFLAGLGIGVSVGFGAFLMGAIVSVLSALALERFGYSADNSAQEPLMNALGSWISDNPAVAIPAAYLVVALVGPAVEELVFRGAVFGGLYRLGQSLLGKPSGEKPGRGAGWIPFVAATLLSSAFFATLHLSPVIIPAIFILAITLCALYRYTGSLIPTIAAHATFNSITVTALVATSLIQV